MKYKFVKRAIGVAFILVITVIMNLLLTPHYVSSHYDFTFNVSQVDLKTGSIYTIPVSGNDAKKVKWLSSNHQIAVINEHGQIIAKKPGQTVISAKIKNECSDIVVNVVNKMQSDILVYNDSQVTPAQSEVINKISISNFKVELSSTKYIYDGKAKKPKVTLTTDDNVQLVLNKDYAVKYSHNKKAGTAKVILTGINNYTGTSIAKFKITKPTVTSTATSVPDIEISDLDNSTTTDQSDSNSSITNNTNSYTDPSTSSSNSNQTKSSNTGSSTKKSTTKQSSSTKSTTNKKSETSNKTSSSKSSSSKSNNSSSTSSSSKSSSTTKSTSTNKSTNANKNSETNNGSSNSLNEENETGTDTNSSTESSSDSSSSESSATSNTTENTTTTTN